MPSKALFLFPRFALTVAILLTASVAQAASPRGAVGCWGFDDVKGRLAPDASGQANHAMITAGRLVKGVRGTGLELDGRATSARSASAPSLDAVEALSLEAWVRLHSLEPDLFPAVLRKEEAYGLLTRDPGCPTAAI